MRWKVAAESSTSLFADSCNGQIKEKKTATDKLRQTEETGKSEEKREKERGKNKNTRKILDIFTKTAKTDIAPNEI